MAIKDLVQTLWSLCNILRDDGITFHQYVNELSYLLFLKMAQERKAEDAIPIGYRWGDLLSESKDNRFAFYRRQLVFLGTEGNEQVRAIFANPTSLLRHPESLNLLVEKIDALDWSSAKEEGFGDLYEGLLQKNAQDKKGGAGQYFTPRPLIESIVSVIKPAPGMTIQDPAAGTGGFLVAANEYLRARGSSGAHYTGVELVQDTHRLLLMNAILHDLDGDFLNADSLSQEGAALLSDADLILTNPPFGNKRGGGQASRTDLPTPTSSKQLAFLQHIQLRLTDKGRAAVVLPDTVLSEGNSGRLIREKILNSCDVHTILRVPEIMSRGVV